MDIDFVYCMIIDTIKGHRDLSHAINQHKITKIINDNNWCGEEDCINARTVRRMIEELIRLGNPIISSPVKPGGYAWGGSDGEALQCYKRSRRKGIRILLRARRILRNSERGQMKIW